MKNRDNATSATIRFAQHFTAVNERVLVDQLYKHPYYPSLLSISEILQFEGIRNFAAKVKPQDLPRMTFPIMAHLNVKGGVFVVVNKLINNKISYWLDGKVISEPVESFNEKWTNTVLIPESELTPKKNLKISYQLIRSIAITALLTLLIGLSVWHAANFTLFVPTVFFGQVSSLVMGLAVAILIILQSIDHRNPLVQQLCGSSTKADCNHILGSKAAKITSWLGWADIGLFYYTGSLLLLMNSENITTTNLLCAFNVLSLPFTFYSVYYQFRAAESWCRLCLYIQALLWIQGGFSIYYLLNLSSPYSIDFYESIKALSIFILPAFLWLLVKPILQDFIQLSPLKKQLNRLKFDIEFFKFHLLKTAKYATPADISFVLGNPNAALEITMVSNPFCTPCAKAHEMLDQWLKKGLDFKLNIIFMPGSDKQLKYQFIHHLFTLKAHDYTIAKNALHSWFENEESELNTWKEKFPVNNNNRTDLRAFLEKQNDWCKLTEIIGTPTFLINGYKTPANYQLKDLKYILLNWNN